MTSQYVKYSFAQFFPRSLPGEKNRLFADGIYLETAPSPPPPSWRPNIFPPHPAIGAQEGMRSGEGEPQGAEPLEVPLSRTLSPPEPRLVWLGKGDVGRRMGAGPAGEQAKITLFAQRSLSVRQDGGPKGLR